MENIVCINHQDNYYRIRYLSIWHLLLFTSFEISIVYEYTIWLEVHVKLGTKHKIFCYCENTQDFDNTTPNTHICPTCTAHPGGLPVLNPECIQTAIRLWHIFKSHLNRNFRRDRKSYFYPDIPAGFQITQLYEPIITWWSIKFYTDSFQSAQEIHIHEAHLENDTAKTISIDGTTYIDFNRAWGPLIEIVTKPEFTSQDQVIEFLKELQRVIRRNEIGYADLEKGQMRVDVNISTKPTGSRTLGTRVEVKNINSFASIRKAIQYEFTRQSELLSANQQVDQETRRRDDATSTTQSMRSKEQAHDYRYFVENDIPPVDPQSIVRDAQCENITGYDRVTQLLDFGFQKEYIHGLINNELLYDWFQTILVSIRSIDPKLVAKRLLGPIAKQFNELGRIVIDQDEFIKFLGKVHTGELSTHLAKILIDGRIEDQSTLAQAENKYLPSSIGTLSIDSIVQSVLADNPKVVAEYQWWKVSTLSFFVGQVMKQTKWAFPAQDIQKTLEQYLNPNPSSPSI